LPPPLIEGRAGRGNSINYLPQPLFFKEGRKTLLLRLPLQKKW